MIRNAGRLIVIAGPSGVGKGTLINRVLPQLDETVLSTSATTRPMRAEEEHGRDYFFLSPDEFEKKVVQGDFIEQVQYGSNRYGTLRSEVEENLGSGRNVILEIEVEGARNVRQMYPEALMIFIAPPSIEELGKRLAGRQTESDAEIQVRLERARQELAAQDEFDYIVINHEINQAADELQKLIKRNLREAG